MISENNPSFKNLPRKGGITFFELLEGFSQEVWVSFIVA